LISWHLLKSLIQQWSQYFTQFTAKKTHPVGLSDTALDTIVQCYVRQAFPTGLSNMVPENSVRCHVKQTWFNGFFRHGIGQLCAIPCQTTGFNEFVRHGCWSVNLGTAWYTLLNKSMWDFQTALEAMSTICTLFHKSGVYR
jgi:hypothetical protein